MVSLLIKFPHKDAAPKQTATVGLFSYQIRLTVHLSEALTDIHPLKTRPPFHSQLHAEESCLLGGHFLKLSMFLFWIQKSLDRLTMCPL